MRLVEQWREIERGLPDEWSDARLLLTLREESHGDRATALLGPAAPGRSRNRIRFYCARGGAGLGPDGVRRLLAKLDQERIEGDLELVATGEQEEKPVVDDRPTLAASWDAATAALPDDWSDLYAELELRSTDHLERAALLLSPLNPARFGGRPGFRFRVARNFGYGASPAMARRCLARLDEAKIPATVEILRALSDTDPVDTQGPVWYIGGKSV